MNKQARVQQLIENMIMEVRLPTGYFLVTKGFTLPSADKEWESVFSQGETLQLNPSSKSIKTLSKFDGSWVDKDISLIDLMQPQQYKIFQQSVRKLTPEEIKNIVGVTVTPDVEFTTTIRGMQKKIQELKLAPGTKIKVTVIK